MSLTAREIALGRNVVTLARSINHALSTDDEIKRADAFQLMAAMCVLVAGLIDQLAKTPAIREKGMQAAFDMIKAAADSHAGIAGVLAATPPLGHA